MYVTRVLGVRPVVTVVAVVLPEERAGCLGVSCLLELCRAELTSHCLLHGTPVICTHQRAFRHPDCSTIITDRIAWARPNLDLNPPYFSLGSVLLGVLWCCGALA